MNRCIDLKLLAADAIGNGTTKEGPTPTEPGATPLTAELNLCVTTTGNTAFIMPPCEMGKRVFVFCSDQFPAVLFGHGNDDFIVGGQYAGTATVQPQSMTMFVSLESQWVGFPSA